MAMNRIIINFHGGFFGKNCMKKLYSKLFFDFYSVTGKCIDWKYNKEILKNLNFAINSQI